VSYRNVEYIDQATAADEDCDVVLNVSHLVPDSHVGCKWFIKNGMSIYSLQMPRSYEDFIDDPSNCITLRTDLHACLDSAAWLVFPMHEKKQYGAYFYWAEEEPSAAQFYHAVPIRLDSTISEAFLFARFAYNVFRRLNAIVLPPTPSKKRSKRRQSIREESTASGDEELLNASATPATSNRPKRTAATASAQRDMETAGPRSPSETWRLVDTVWRYSDEHPEISALAHPSRVSTSEEEWRRLLDDDDERRQYDT